MTTNYDLLRMTLCSNCLLDPQWDLKKQLLFLYTESNLSSNQIAIVSNNLVSFVTVIRLLRNYSIKIKSKGGCNNRIKK